MIIHLLVIDHRHGRDYWVFTTEEAACAQLDAYVQDWWEKEMDEAPMPDDPDERSEQYFDCNEDESFDIVGLEVQGQGEEDKQ
jgi:hypothetical protein